jgi:hypothetical protein
MEATLVAAILAAEASAQEVTRVTAILAAETFAQEAATAQDSTTILFKDAEDWAAPTKREAHERVSRVEAENATALASACEDAEGLAQKVALLEGELAEARQD